MASHILTHWRHVSALGVADSFHSVLFHTALPYMLKEMWLYADEVYACESVCRAALQAEKGTTFVKRWLGHRELVFVASGGWHLQVSLRTDYRAAMYQREFLREVALRAPHAVVAGSFAAAQHLMQRSLSTFLPNDIDIFAFSDVDVGIVQNCYKQCVASPLGLCLYCTQHRRILDSDLPVFSEAMLNTAATRQRALDWVASVRASVLKDVRLPIGSRLSKLQNLQHIEDNISVHRDMGCNPGYAIDCTWRLVLKKASQGSDVPLLLIPVNVICVSFPCGSEAPAPASDSVINFFDILPCRLTLHARTNLQYICGGPVDAINALEARELTLCKYSFPNDTHRFEQQMDRLMKYVDRGFRLAPVTGRVLARSRCEHALGVDEVRVATQTDEYSNSSDTGDSCAHAQIGMRSERVLAAFQMYAGFDYWMQCEDGLSRGVDPIVAYFVARSEGGELHSVST